MTTATATLATLKTAEEEAWSLYLADILDAGGYLQASQVFRKGVRTLARRTGSPGARARILKVSYGLASPAPIANVIRWTIQGTEVL